MGALLILLVAVLGAPSGAVRCPLPHVTHLSVGPVGEDGERLALRVRAEMERGAIGAFDVRWGGSSALIADGWWHRGGSATFEHRYPAPGTYRITVVAEGSTRGCKRVQKAKPATLRVRVPLSRTTSPSSP